MIDSRFSNAGGAAFVSGFEAQQAPAHHHRHRHHRHRKGKHANAGVSPLSRDESIHKVDHGGAQYFQQNDVQYGGGFGVPYPVNGFGAPPPAGYYQQAPFPGSNFGYGNQIQETVFAQGQYGGTSVPSTAKHHRHHRRHHHHHGGSALDTSQAVPEQLIGQRSSSVVGGQGGPGRSPPAQVQGENPGDRVSHHRHRHHRHHHHHGGEHQGSHSAHHSHTHHSHSSGGADGYGHINEELIFIERGDHSPHRQQPPAGYEYKGKIEVQSVDRQSRSRSRGPTFVGPMPIPLPQPIAPTVGPCPPGWQQVILPGGSIGQSSLGGIGGFGGVIGGVGFGGIVPAGSAGMGGGFSSLTSSYPIPGQGQIVADYIIESSAGGSGSGTFFQQGGGPTLVEQYASEGTEELVSTRSKVIEVWQKRSKSQPREKSSSRSSSRERTKSPQQGPSFDFESFRQEILTAIERIVRTNESLTAKIQWTGNDGGIQTEIRPAHKHRRDSSDSERKTSGEVRVIVQPIQPIFYMPRQTEGPAPGPAPAPYVPAPVIQQVASEPKIVYVPRNVYVPVIKPVFVPRERVIVRPQVIHVARPVLVDRPVPVTQRPIIIDRERPIPVPVRAAPQGGGSQVVREEYVYRDNLPVAYGGRCAEYAGGINYGYMPTQEQHQYAASSVQEINSGYQAQGPVINITVPNQYQQSETVTQVSYQQGAGNFEELYGGAAQASSGSVLQGLGIAGGGPIEVLDPTVDSSWHRTDQSSLLNRYGPSALDIVQKTNNVEQQMFRELRQRNSSVGNVQRSVSAASFGSGGGVRIARGGNSFSSIPLGDLNNFNPEGIPHQGPAPIPVRINY